MKKSKLKEIDFYLVTDSGLSRNGTLNDVEQAINAGCKIIQYREKNKSTRQMIEEAAQLKKMCEKKAIFIVNDRVDVAIAVNADGVHLGQEDMPFEIARKILGVEKIIGLTTHDIEESLNAEKMGADYIGLSPIFETSTKKDAGMSCGTSMLSRVRQEVKLPVVAIGGINKSNVGKVIKAGADAVVSISAVVCAAHVYEEVSGFIKIINRAKGKSKAIRSK